MCCRFAERHVDWTALKWMRAMQMWNDAAFQKIFNKDFDVGFIHLAKFESELVKLPW